MKSQNTVLFILFFLLQIVAFGQNKSSQIKETDFQLVEEILDTFENKKVVKLLQGEKVLHEHILYEIIGDCSAINLTLGTYTIDKNEITFYSYWAAADRQPMPLVPFGFRKQTYRIDSLGQMELTSSAAYIEDYVMKDVGNEQYYESNDWLHLGYELLSRKPENEFEESALEDYIKHIEAKYESKFIMGEQKDLLEKEVREILKNEIALHTADWKEGEIYGGIRK